ncbi:MarR family transcriptional regulator [Trinickia caryophylli]|uniref:Transcriptional regulator, MarR family n=1 Tax=Trinickia caryophylli TaxID=28094 RepID=A0A1X7FXV6_TRICW|nr:MarR family winged helix-turn-helix transcriptional regulator [Trinickia caryophylli]GLU34693.1 MarR family transcriptional regulator [Trinickia caryophylli]SMF59961.1 transcriptional regulator, MarR family [Trinickia caryophylli]
MSQGPLRLNCHCGTLRQAARAVTSLYDARLAKHGIRITQFTILMALRGGEKLSTGLLSTLLLLDQTTLSRTLATLQTRKLVSAQTADEDRRMRLWSLTRKGGTLLEACLPDWEEAQKELARRIGKRDIQAFGDEVYAVTEALAG